MNKDFLLKNKTLIVVIALVAVVAVVAGIVTNGNKSTSSSTTSTKPTLSSLSDRADGFASSITTLTNTDNDFINQLGVIITRLNTSDENYQDVSDNQATLLRNISTLQAWQTAHDAATPTPTPTPAPNASAAAAATPTPTPTPAPVNHAPVIDTFVVDPPILAVADGYALATCTAHDPDGDALTYSWVASNGSISGAGRSVWWLKAGNGVTGTIGVIVSDGDLSANYTVTIVCN